MSFLITANYREMRIYKFLNSETICSNNFILVPICKSAWNGIQSKFRQLKQLSFMDFSENRTKIKFLYFY